MKTLAGLLLLAGLSVLTPAAAQLSVHINITSQPLWGPTSYDYVEYYYLPEAEVYYYVPTSQFIYWHSGHWVFASYMPAIYHCDLYSTYKVVVNSPKPYMNHGMYKQKYGKYKSMKSKQMAIRDSPDKKYHGVKGHPKNSQVKSPKPNSSKPGVIKPGNTKPVGAKPNGGKPASSKPGATKPTSPKQNGKKGN